MCCRCFRTSMNYNVVANFHVLLFLFFTSRYYHCALTFCVQTDSTALIRASIKGHIPVVNLLLKANASANDKDKVNYAHLTKDLTLTMRTFVSSIKTKNGVGYLESISICYISLPSLGCYNLYLLSMTTLCLRS